MGLEALTEALRLRFLECFIQSYEVSLRKGRRKSICLKTHLNNRRRFRFRFNLLISFSRNYVRFRGMRKAEIQNPPIWGFRITSAEMTPQFVLMEKFTAAQLLSQTGNLHRPFSLWQLAHVKFLLQFYAWLKRWVITSLICNVPVRPPVSALGRQLPPHLKSLRIKVITKCFMVMCPHRRSCQLELPLTALTSDLLCWETVLSLFYDLHLLSESPRLQVWSI